jgi:HTH-type transcriptional regulator, sugar sensing transcriptional regulator
MRCFHNNAPPMDSTDTRALDTLAQLGFTQYQARVWLAMTRGFPVTAYELARRCELPRPNVYAAVKRLVELGAAEQVGHQPDTYAPADPRTFLERQAGELRDRCHALSATLAQRIQRSGRGSIRTATGLTDCEAHLRGEIHEARSYLWLKGRASQLGRYRDELGAALRRGVSIKLIAFGRHDALTKALRGAQVFAHEGSGQRITGATDALLTLARDGEAVTTVSFAAPPQLTYARDHLLVYVIHSYLLHEVFLAEMASAPRDGAAVRAQIGRLRQRHRPAGMERSVAGV